MSPIFCECLPMLFRKFPKNSDATGIAKGPARRPADPESFRVRPGWALRPAPRCDLWYALRCFHIKSFCVNYFRYTIFMNSGFRPMPSNISQGSLVWLNSKKTSTLENYVDVIDTFLERKQQHLIIQYNFHFTIFKYFK